MSKSAMSLRRSIAAATVVGLLVGGLAPVRGASRAAPLAKRGSGSDAIAGPLWKEPDQLERIYGAIDDARKSIPRDTFNPAAIARTVGADPARLFEWVRDHTYWVPYRGALRGPVGVAMDRVGNTLDRALLLAELLRVSGQTVRLVQGELDEAQALRVLSQLRPVPRRALKADAQQDSRHGEDLEQFAARHHLNRDLLVRITSDAVRASHELTQALERRVPEQARFLSNAVGGTRVDDGAAAAVDALRDHWWVQRREGAMWTDLDPLLPSSRGGQAITPALKTLPYDASAGSLPLPDEYLHGIGIRFVIESWQGGSLNQQVALEHRFRPAEVFGSSIRLEAVPVSLRSDTLGSANAPPAILGAIAAQREWLPVLTIGEHQFAEALVTDTGDLLPYPKTDDRRSPVSRSVQDAFDALGGGGDDPPESHLVAAWIEYEIQVPGMPARRVRRDVFDLYTHEQRSMQPLPPPPLDDSSRLQRAVHLLGTVHLLPMVCRPAVPYVESELLRDALVNRSEITNIVRQPTRTVAATLQDKARALVPNDDALLAFALGRFELSPVADDVFLDRPNLVSYRTTFSLSPQGELVVSRGLDVLTNEIAVRWGAPSAYDTRLIQGTLDTNLEALILGPDAINAGTTLAYRPRGTASWTTIRSVDDPSWAKTGWTARQRRRTEQDLKAGYVVVVPTLSPGSSENAVWWRINPRSGDTLGFGPDGWGQAMVTKVLMEVAVPIAGAFAIGFNVGAWLCVWRKGGIGVGGPGDWEECACAGLASGAAAGAAAAGVVAAVLAAPAGAAAAVATQASVLQGWSLGMGTAMVLPAMIKEGLCVSKP